MNVHFDKACVLLFLGTQGPAFMLFRAFDSYQL